MKVLELKKILKLTAILLITAGLFACEEKTEPVEVFFMEYPLSEYACSWTNLAYNDRVIVINSNEDLKKYISCGNDYSHNKAIDFSLHTLLLASGITDYGVVDITQILQQISTNEYRLLLQHRQKLLPSSTCSWATGVLVPKLPQNAQISLEFDYKDENIDMSQIDFGNIEDLYRQPLPVIQKAVSGKWKWYVSYEGLSGPNYYNDTVDIHGDYFVLPHGTSRPVDSFTWKIQSVDKGYKTYVMWSKSRNKAGWYFVSIKNDILDVWIDIPQGSASILNHHGFARIK